jgi:hypothetical protein
MLYVLNRNSRLLVRLTCLIHEFFEFVNKHLQTKKNLRAGFDRVLRTQLKASPERRPEKAAVEALGTLGP